MEEHLNRKLSGLASPYLARPAPGDGGLRLVFYNPLVMPERAGLAPGGARPGAASASSSAQRDLQNRCDAAGGAARRTSSPRCSSRSSTCATARRAGLEALSRGPDGQRLPEPAAPVRAGRRGRPRLRARPPVPPPRARTAAATCRAAPKLFVNVLPSSMYDPDFQGAASIRLARGPRASRRPDRARDHREVRDRELRRCSPRRCRTSRSSASRSRSTTSAPATRASRRSPT